MKRLLMVAAVMALGGCSLDRQSAPSLSGPSEFALSLQITATPDLITWDGFSQATVSVFARDPNNQPVRGLSMHLDIGTSAGLADFGTLSSKTISTNNAGRASAVYIAPPSPGPSVGQDEHVTIFVTPVGSNYHNANARSVETTPSRTSHSSTARTDICPSDCGPVLSSPRANIRAPPPVRFTL